METSYNIEEKKVIEEAIEKSNDPNAGKDIVCLAMQSISTLTDEDELQTFKEACDHPDKNEKMKWPEAMKKEFHDMSNGKYRDKYLKAFYFQINTVLRAYVF